MAAVLVPDREPVQFDAVHFLLMLSRNFGQNELQVADECPEKAVLLTDLAEIFTRNTITLSHQVEPPRQIAMQHCRQQKKQISGESAHPYPSHPSRAEPLGNENLAPSLGFWALFIVAQERDSQVRVRDSLCR